MIDDASTETKLDDFAERHRPTLGRTDRAAYRDAMDASKKSGDEWAEMPVWDRDNTHTISLFFVKMVPA